MEAGKPLNKVFDNFRIQDNVLIGPRVKIKRDWAHIGQALFESMSEHADDIGQTCGTTGYSVTYGQMKNQSIRLALWLKNQGIEKDDIIASSTKNHLTSTLPMVASLMIGAAFTYWIVDLNLDKARHLMKLCRPKIIFVCKRNIKVLIEAAEIEQIFPKMISFEKDELVQSIDDVMKEQSEKKVSTFEVSKTVTDDDLALIALTIGSTGKNKGVMFSYKSLYNNAIMFSDFWKVEKGWKILWGGWLHSNSVIHFILNTILRGSEIVLVQDTDLKVICNVVENHKVEWLCISSVLFVQLHQSNLLQKYKLKYLKLLQTGGEKIHKLVFEQMKQTLPNVDIVYCYDVSEIGNVCTTLNLKESNDLESIGYIRGNKFLKIEDVNNGSTLGLNQLGEILLKSPDRMNGYYGGTAEKVLDDEGWIHTGDLGYYKENGSIYIINRLKDITKVSGYDVNPVEIENSLIYHPGVLAIAIVSFPHSTEGNRLMAFVKKTIDSELTEEELIQASELLHPLKKLTGGVKFLTELPTIEETKIDKITLRQMAEIYGKLD